MKAITLDRARELIFQTAPPRSVEMLDLVDAYGRVLAEDVAALEDIPKEPRSRMDGFAVRAFDTMRAGAGRPVFLKVLAEISAAGHPCESALPPGSALRIFTGAPLPFGADAVIPQEDASMDRDCIRVACPISPGAWVYGKGADARKGAPVLKAGDRLTSTRLGIVAGLNIPKVWVYRVPQVAVLGTGDELVEPGTRFDGPFTPCNGRILLEAMLRSLGIHAEVLGCAKDDVDEIAERVGNAREDVVISTGGVGRGDRDLVLTAWKKVGVSILFREILVSPGRCTALGLKGRQLYVALPGGPWAAQVLFLELVRPMLLKIMGMDPFKDFCMPAPLGGSLSKRRGLSKIFHGYLRRDVKPWVFVPEQSSPERAFLETLRHREGYVVVGDDETEWAVERWVDVRLLDPWEPPRSSC